MTRFFMPVAALSGLLAVLLGAFGAHALRGGLDAASQSVFETAVHYHFTHTLALLAVGILCRNSAPSRLLVGSGLGFSLGLLVFCGSLYLLSVTGIRWLGAITPVGGIAFLVGWFLLLLWAWKTRS